MSNQKITYYQLEEIEKEDATINIIFGERSDLMVNHIRLSIRKQ